MKSETQFGGEEYIVRMERNVSLRIAEVRNLPKGVTGTFVEIWVEDRKESVGRTLTKYKEKNPFFGEELSLHLADNELIIHMLLFKERKERKSSGHSPKKPTEIGHLSLNLDEISQGENWYNMENLKKAQKHGNIDIRLNITYSETTILPSDKYTKLLDMLLDKSSDFKVIMLMSSSRYVKPKETVELAELLCKIGEYKGVAPDIINVLVIQDIQSCDSKENLFRGNSVGTKVLDLFMKLKASRWLDCLRPIIQTIISTDLNCEVRQGKLTPEDDLEQNLQNLEKFFSVTMKAIFSSVHQCPISLRQICYSIRKEVQKVFKEDDDVCYTSITGFLFLRFFVPAIMTPKLFGLSIDYPTGYAERTFTLIATLVQKLANLQIFESHESHINRLNPILIQEQENIKIFLNILCESDVPVDEEAISVNLNIDLDLQVARLCRHLADNLIPLEDALTGPSGKFVALFLCELEVVFEEMKFLWKKFKNTQAKNRISHYSVSTLPDLEEVPVLSRERSNSEKLTVDLDSKKKRSFSLERLVKAHSKGKESKSPCESPEGEKNG